MVAHLQPFSPFTAKIHNRNNHSTLPSAAWHGTSGANGFLCSALPTINVYTLYVATIFVFTFYVLYLCIKSK